MANHRKHEAVVHKDSDSWQGRRFGFLTVLKLSRPRCIVETGLYTYYVRCQCVCGLTLDRSPIKLERGECLGCYNCESSRLLTDTSKKLLLEYFPRIQRFVRQRYYRAYDLDEVESAAIATLIDVCREKSHMSCERFKKHLYSRVTTTCKRTISNRKIAISLDQGHDVYDFEIEDPWNFIQLIENIDLINSFNLSDIEMLVIKGFFQEGKNQEEIGLDIGFSGSTARVILNKTIARLQNLSLSKVS